MKVKTALTSLFLMSAVAFSMPEETQAQSRYYGAGQQQNTYWCNNIENQGDLFRCLEDGKFSGNLLTYLASETDYGSDLYPDGFERNAFLFFRNCQACNDSKQTYYQLTDLQREMLNAVDPEAEKDKPISPELKALAIKFLEEWRQCNIEFGEFVKKNANVDWISSRFFTFAETADRIIEDLEAYDPELFKEDIEQKSDSTSMNFQKFEY